MKAIRYYSYGSPDVLQLADVDVPPIGDDDVLVRVRAAGVNPLDWHYLRGLPYVVRPNTGFRRPKFTGLGAEYVSFSQDAMLAAKPASLTFEEAAAVPVAGVSALQALRDKANVQPGQKVLVNGAAGGTGTFTVQLAKTFGAEVTGVCGTGNVELVRSLGADEVIDYTKDDFTRNGKRYDVLIDNAASRSLADTKRVLAPKGVHVGVGLASKGHWFGPVARPLGMVTRNPFVSRRLAPFLGQNSAEDLVAFVG